MPGGNRPPSGRALSPGMNLLASLTNAYPADGRFAVRDGTHVQAHEDGQCRPVVVSRDAIREGNCRARLCRRTEPGPADAFAQTHSWREAPLRGPVTPSRSSA